MRKMKCARGMHRGVMAKLSLDELKLVLSEVSSVCEKWYCIGFELDLPVDYLEDLDTQLSAEKIDVGSCLRKVLVKWIKSKQATWSTLIKALGGDLVKEEGLASVLQKKYGTSSLGKSDTNEAKIKNLVSKVRKVTRRVQYSSKGTKVKRSKYGVKLPDTFSPDDFVKAPTADRLCIKCKRVPSFPLRSNCCNKLYCESCSVKSRKCGTHRRVNHYTIDRELQRKLTKLTRKCPNHESGCNWKGLGWKLSQHLSKCSKTALNTGNCAKPEVSSTNDSSTTSVVLAPLSEDVVVIEDTPTTNQHKFTHSQLLETPTRAQESSIEVQPNSNQETPLRVHQSNPKRSLLLSGSCYLLRAPPLNLAMENVSEYIDSEDAWLSESFLSHQIGYKICLAVRIGSSSGNSGMLNVMLGIASAEGHQGSYLVYPCTGLAKIAILNPMEDYDHHVLELMFTLEKSSHHEIAGEAVQIPRYFVTHANSLFFRVERIDLDKIKYKVWLLDTENCEGKSNIRVESSEEDVVSLQ